MAQVPQGQRRMKFGWRTAVAFGHDVLACALAWVAAFWLRFNLDIPQAYANVMWPTLPNVVVVHAVVFWVFGLYRGLWHYASLPDLKRILSAVGVAAVMVTALLFMVRAGVPRSVFILSPILLAGLMCGNRLAYRALKERWV